MAWLAPLLSEPSVAGTIIALSVVIALGLAIGAAKFRGIGLGVAGVLFVGLLAGTRGADGGVRIATVPIEESVLHLLREAGLILFVFTIGVQIGPGFAASLRRSGMKLNVLAGIGVVLGTVLAAGLGLAFGLKPGVTVGILAGATTNTPSLAAAQAMLTDRAHAGDSSIATAGYAVAYPMGVIGTILSMMVARAMRRRPGVAVESASDPAPRSPSRRSVEITNPNLSGVELGRLHMLEELGLVITRRLSAGRVEVPTKAAKLRVGDVLLLVGPQGSLDEACLLLGRESPIDLSALPSEIMSKRMVITKREVLGKSIREVDPTGKFGVSISRVSRAGVELAPTPDFRFNFADSVLAVGPEENVKRLSAFVGDSARTLDHAQMVTVFLGIALGVLLGSVPIAIPGLPGSLKLGLAGGPLIVAIVLSRFGRVGPMVCYLPISANFALREIGIALFLACVGVTSGPAFVHGALSIEGLTWLGIGTAVTILPLLLVGGLARWFFGMQLSPTLGVLAGGMTDPPALAFANSITQSEDPGTAYSTVYPLTMLMRVMCIQILAALIT